MFCIALPAWAFSPIFATRLSVSESSYGRVKRYHYVIYCFICSSYVRFIYAILLNYLLKGCSSEDLSSVKGYLKLSWMKNTKK